MAYVVCTDVFADLLTVRFTAAEPSPLLPPQSDSKPIPTWRLIPLLEATGAEQMAIDTWLLQGYQRGKLPSTLRFYRWDPAAISLGHLQKQWPEEWHSITYRGQGLDLVRRPTGGRAVLHQGDLSYGLVTSPGTGQHWQIYREICDLLISGWGRLGVELRYGSAGRGYIHNPSCFNTATAADLVTWEGQKLIGSAQRRSKGAILQHGSMLLSTDRALFERIFDQPAPWDRSLYAEAELEQQIPIIVQALTDTFMEQLGIELIHQPLSDQEWQEIAGVCSKMNPLRPLPGGASNLENSGIGNP